MSGGSRMYEQETEQETDHETAAVATNFPEGDAAATLPVSGQARLYP